MTVEKYVKNAVLDFLDGAERFTITDIIKATGYREPSVRSVLIRMIDSGIIKKVDIGTDRRMIYEVVSEETLFNVTASEKMDIFDQCRANWQGYKLHKVFGSAGRGC
ncbi:hypothetical protein CEW81_18190 [Kluyvera genomosp. 3]|uniref:Uncharacterized protein n=1 Tax=Kluyvera genomosp. 3 TaxID=2774055 RepID=A0A248KJR0_9ENTR|nr:hypothetical protein CEW81_18190 [Kluyvera genomosp. 3]